MSCTLIKLCQTASQISRISFLARHLFKTSRHLSKRLCPTRCRICHQRYRITHVTEILRDRNSRINRRFTGSNRHIRRIGDQNCSLHQRLTCLRVFQFRKLVQNVCHLISTLSASEIHNDICFRPFCKLMLDHCLTASERSRHCCHTAFCDREKRIDHSLSCYKRHLWRKFLFIRTSTANRPFLHQCQFSVSVFRLNDSHNFFYCKLSCLDFFNCSLYSIRNHDLLLHENRLLHCSDHVSRLDFISDFCSRNKFPFQVSFQRRNFHAAL